MNRIVLCVWFAVIVVLCFGSIYILGFLGHRSEFAPTDKPATVLVNVDDYIISKRAKSPVKSEYTPVLIYKHLGGTGATLAGVGSVITGREGEMVVTAEHLLRKDYGAQVFACRKLQPLEEYITHSVEKVLHKGAELAPHPGESPDIVVLKLGDVAKPIECYADRTDVVQTGKGNARPFVERKTLTSLVSGEQVSTLGLIGGIDNGVEYTLVNYPNVAGESGTGFVTDEDELYVLKGHLDVPPQDVEAFEKHFGTSKNLGLLYGPIRFTP